MSFLFAKLKECVIFLSKYLRHLINTKIYNKLEIDKTLKHFNINKKCHCLFLLSHQREFC